MSKTVFRVAPPPPLNKLDVDRTLGVAAGETRVIVHLNCDFKIQISPISGKSNAKHTCL